MGMLESIARRPGVVTRLEQSQMLRAVATFSAMIGTIIARIDQSPPSPGYEPYLVKLGCNPIAARGLAAIAVRSGQRQENDARQQREVVEAIRFLARARHQRCTVLLRAKVLLSAWENSSVIEEIFAKLHRDEFEFIRLLKSVVETRGRVPVQLREIAADVALRLTCRRGPKISAQAIAHELFTQSVSAFTKQKARAYTWSFKHDDFIDPLTRATRCEFSDLHFDPRTTRQRAKAREDKRARSS